MEQKILENMFDWVLRRGSKELNFTVNELIEGQKNIRQDILRFDYFRGQNDTMSVFLAIYFPPKKRVDYFISGSGIKAFFEITKNDKEYILNSDDERFNEDVRKSVELAFESIWEKRVDKNRRGPNRRNDFSEYFLEKEDEATISKEESDENFIEACRDNFFEYEFTVICSKANLLCLRV